MTRIPHFGRPMAAAVRACISMLIEELEGRVLLSGTFSVTDTSDSGPGSFRQAILDSNASRPATGTNQIIFAIPAAGVQTIVPASPLPVVTSPVTISADLDPFSRLPVVQLDGHKAGTFSDGLVIAPTAQGSGVGGLSIGQFGWDGLVLQATGALASGCNLFGNGGNGIVASASASITQCIIEANALAGIVSTADQVKITASFIGTSPNSLRGNGHEGIIATSSDVIGGPGEQRNIISDNGYSGILIIGAQGGGLIENNSIGIDPTGPYTAPNGLNPAAPYRDGITVLSPGVSIAGNIVAGNKGNGIFIGGQTGLATQITGNVIGSNTVSSQSLGNGANGILLAAGNVTVGSNLHSPANLPPGSGGNVISKNVGDGILILSSNNTVQGNYIGQSSMGVPLGNGANGIEIRGGNKNNVGLGNVICANQNAGISIRTDSSGAGGAGNDIGSNIIGTTSTINQRLGNLGNGVEVFASNNSIENNVISGSGASGVFLGDAYGVPQSGNKLSNNVIGPPLQNPYENFNFGNGVTIFRSSHNTITGDTIEHNRGAGVDVIAGAPGAADAVGNQIAPQADYANGGIGIDLGDDGVTPNHPGGAAVGGANNLQNFPVILSVRPVNNNGLVVPFTLDAPPGKYTIEFYSDSTPDRRGYGQGEKQLVPQTATGVETITIGNTPGAIFTARLLGPLPAGSVVTATATSAGGDTSEFSQDVAVSAPPPQVISYSGPNRQAQSITVSYTFNQDVSASLTPAALQFRDLDTSTDYAAAGVTYDAVRDVATFTLPASLPAGHYQATLLAADVANSKGVHLNDDGDGTGGHSYLFLFTLPAASPDSSVMLDFNYLVALARNFGQAGTLASGDLNGDGIVDFKDLVLLARNYGRPLSV